MNCPDTKPQSLPQNLTEAHDFSDSVPGNSLQRWPNFGGEW